MFNLSVQLLFCKGKASLRSCLPWYSCSRATGDCLRRCSPHRTHTRVTSAACEDYDRPHACGAPAGRASGAIYILRRPLSTWSWYSARRSASRRITRPFGQTCHCRSSQASFSIRRAVREAIRQADDGRMPPSALIVAGLIRAFMKQRDQSARPWPRVSSSRSARAQPRRSHRPS